MTDQHSQLREPLRGNSARTVSDQVSGRAWFARFRLTRALLSQCHRNLSRQLHRERGALPDLRVDGDLAAVALDELVHDRETEARALTDVLRREERIEDARQD